VKILNFINYNMKKLKYSKLNKWFNKVEKFCQHNIDGERLDFNLKTDIPNYDSTLDENTEVHAWGETLNKKKYYEKYKGVKSHIEYLTPEKYIDICVNGEYNKFRNIYSLDEFKKIYIHSREINQDNIKKYENLWVSGISNPPMGFIRYIDGKYEDQEGMHRAILAKKLNVKSIPVLIINQTVKKASLNWFKKAQYEEEEISPEEVQYDTKWGDHHGPVKMKRDFWNHGKPGYSDFHRPMPLPKKLYHVTPFPNEILKEGFLIQTDTKKQTFGGAHKAVSFTTLSNARLYQDALKDFIRVANGKINLNNLSYLVKKWDIRENWVNDTIKHVAIAETPEDKRKAIASQMAYLHIYSSRNFPMFAFASNTYKKFENFDENNVKIIEVETSPLKWHHGANIWDDTNMKENYVYVKGENEWRIYGPESLKNIRIIE